VYRVQAGPYASREDALQAAARIEQALDLKPVVISR
jgi:cell division septation protein DedD